MTTASGRVPNALVGLGVRVLPAGYRPRYRVELAAELLDLPRQQRVGHALRFLVRSPVLRSALTRYRPTIGETLMATGSGSYNYSELRRRQASGDVGHAVLGSLDRVSSRRRWKILAVPFAVLVIGLILGLWGPVPGLGMFMVMGGAMGMIGVAVRAFNDMFS